MVDTKTGGSFTSFAGNRKPRLIVRSPIPALSHARLPWNLNQAMAAADVAPHFGAELKVLILDGDFADA